MTINNFTFFSPNGTEFPVGSNNDAKLYMMLTGMDYTTFRRTDWKSPIDTALNRQYVNTSLIVAGRYFELVSETVALEANSTNFIHVNIDLTQTDAPVSLSVEQTDNSNTIDLNNDSGVYKRVIDILTTDGLSVTGSTKPEEVTKIEKLQAEKTTVTDLEYTGSLKVPAKQVIASGAWWLGSGQVANVSKPISECSNGWILHFTEYTSGMNGNTKNGQNHWFFIPKEYQQLSDVGHSFTLTHSNGFTTFKYVYIQGNKITGTAANDNTNSRRFALQHVLEY